MTKLLIAMYKKLFFIKDSCDGSGLNTSENSKDSHPLSSGGLFEWYYSTFIQDFLHGNPRITLASLKVAQMFISTQLLNEWS